MKPDDNQLVRRCLEGEVDAFEGLLERYEKPVFNVAFRIVGDREEAQDVVQSVFLNAYRSLRTFDRSQRFFSWIYRIAVNESLRSVGNRRTVQPLDEGLRATERDPAESAQAGELCGAVRSAVMQLTHDHRTVIVLRHHIGCSYNDIASILDLPLKTVKSRLFEARKQLKRQLVKRRVRDC